MTRPRKALISLVDTPYYHITSRVARATLISAGWTIYSGQNYGHRRQWVVDRVRLLSSLFVIDVCAYAVMSNHYHLVFKVCPESWMTFPMMKSWTADTRSSEARSWSKATETVKRSSLSSGRRCPI